MKKTGIIIFLMITCVSFFYSCTEESKIESRPINLDCLRSNLEKINTMIANTTVGTADGTYPLVNSKNLQKASENLELGLSKGLADMFTLQYEADNYCIAAGKAIAEYENSLQKTLEVGKPAELIVYGIDGKGHIEFGQSPAYGGDNSFTVEAWLKYNAGFFESGIGAFITTFDGSTQPVEGWMINFLGDNLRSTIGMGPQFARVLEFGSKYPTNYGEWNHLAMVYDSSLSEGQLKMYVNGKLFFSKTNDITNDAGVLQSYQPNKKNYNMWAFQEPTDLGRNMTGYIKKFRFWNTAKSINDLNALMNSDVTGSESDLECAWDFTSVPADNQKITDKTGKHTAKIVGSYKWKAL